MARNKHQTRGDESNAGDDTVDQEASGTTAAASGDDGEGAQEIYAFPVPAEYKERKGVELLMQACSLYNIDPHEDAEPVHLAAWKFYEGDRRRGVPDRIVLVTNGGLKLAHPADEETVERLRRVFKCFRERKLKDGSTEIDILPLPEDLSLPTTFLDGQVIGREHVYERGYLREGGAAEASRREARKNAQLPK